MKRRPPKKARPRAISSAGAREVARKVVRTAFVRLDGRRAGAIEETEAGFEFVYDRAWVARKDALPVSLTLPLREEPYVSKGLHPFFENLLPEGWLLEIATTKLKIPKDDIFGLLLALGADCIGAVEVVPAERSETAR